MNSDSSDISEFDDTAGPERLLERHLRDYLVKNLEASLGIRLRVLETERAVEGVGRIDIFAEGPLGSLWAIELKIGTATRDAVGQLSSYLGGLEAEGIKARGLVVASAFDKSALAAARAVPNIYLYSYSVQFSCHATGDRKIDNREFKLSLAPQAKRSSQRKESKKKSEDPFSVTSLQAAWPLPIDRKK